MQKRTTSNFMSFILLFQKSTIFITGCLIVTLISCSPDGEKLRQLSTDEVVERLKNQEINQFNIVYKDSVGIELTEELTKKFNRNEMIREFYVDQNDEIAEVRLFDYTHEKVFHEIQVRELLRHPLINYNFIEIDCSKRGQILKEVFGIDQSVRKSDMGNIVESDASNQQIVYSVLKHCGWPNDQELITSIWYVVQHSESEFMALYFSDFVDFVEKGLLKNSDLARMKDRMLMSNGYPQIYGSQVVGKSVYDLRDPLQVNQWRAEVGLGMIEENTRNNGFEFDVNDYIEVNR